MHHSRVAQDSAKQLLDICKRVLNRTLFSLLPASLFKKESRRKVGCRSRTELDSEINLAEHVSKQYAER